MAREEEAGEKGLDVEGTSDEGGGVPWSAGMISAITPLGWASGLCAAGLGLAGRQAVEGGPGGLSGLGTV